MRGSTRVLSVIIVGVDEGVIVTIVTHGQANPRLLRVGPESFNLVVGQRGQVPCLVRAKFGDDCADVLVEETCRNRLHDSPGLVTDVERGLWVLVVVQVLVVVVNLSHGNGLPLCFGVFSGSDKGDALLPLGFASNSDGLGSAIFCPALDKLVDRDGCPEVGAALFNLEVFRTGAGSCVLESFSGR